MTDLEKRLLAHFNKLSQQDAHAVLRFAAFLAEDHTTEKQVLAVDTEGPSQEMPKPILAARPEQERVVDALKRLSTSYPMLEKKKLLDKASTQVAQHIMFGRPAKDAIDEIEKIFAEAYDKFVSEWERR